MRLEKINMYQIRASGKWLLKKGIEERNYSHRGLGKWLIDFGGALSDLLSDYNQGKISYQELEKQITAFLDNDYHYFDNLKESDALGEYELVPAKVEELKELYEL